MLSRKRLKKAIAMRKEIPTIGVPVYPLPDLSGYVALFIGSSNAAGAGYSAARIFCEAGGQSVLTTSKEQLVKRVQKLADLLENDSFAVHCDVTKENTVVKMFEQIEKMCPRLDFILYTPAFLNLEYLSGRSIDTPANDIITSINISALGLIPCVRYAEPLLRRNREGGAILVTSYLGAERAAPNYNMMGVAKATLEATVRAAALDVGTSNIRINVVSLGPFESVASVMIGESVEYMMEKVKSNAPLMRNLSYREIGEGIVRTFLYTASTGTTFYIDCGYSAIISK